MDDSLTPEGVMGAMGGLSINATADGSQLGSGSSVYPGRPGEPDCKYFLRTGTCAYGRNCRFNHPFGALHDHGVSYTLEFPERDGEPDCEYYLRTGTCKYGAACKFNHPKDKQVDVCMNAFGLPMRQDAKPCPFYMRMGVCRYGHACKFHHPQPAPVFFPVLAPPAPLLPLTYLNGSSLQQWQSYPPTFIYPSQDWSMYMGNVWPSSASHIATASSSAAKISTDDLPQQPDRPECRYFITHGMCKYGSNCIYQHPVGRMLQGCESSSVPSSAPPKANEADLNETMTDNSDEPRKGNAPGESPDRTDSFPHSSIASDQNDSD